MDKKQLKKILFLLLAIFGLIAAIVLIPERQLIKKKAFFGTINVRLNPSRVTMPMLVDHEFTVLLEIEASNYKVSGVDLKLDFNPNQLEITSITHNAAAFNNLLFTDLGTTTGRARIVAINVPSNAVDVGLPTGTFTVGEMKIKGKIPSGPTPFVLEINKTDSMVVGESPTNDVVLGIDQVTNGSYSITAGVLTGTPTPTITGGPTPTFAPADQVFIYAVPNDRTSEALAVSGAAGTTFSEDIYFNAGSAVKYVKLTLNDGDLIDTVDCTPKSGFTKDSLDKGENYVTLVLTRSEGIKGYFQLASCQMKVMRTNLDNPNAVNLLQACSPGWGLECKINENGEAGTSYAIVPQHPVDWAAQVIARIRIKPTRRASPGPTATPVPGWTCSGGCASLVVCRRDCLSGTCLQRSSECGWSGYRCCVPAPTSTPTSTPTATPVPTNTPTPTPAGPTSTPTPGGPTSTPPPGGWPILNFKVKFQGVASKRADQKVKVIVKKGSLVKTFADVNVVANDDGIYSGSVTLNEVPARDGYKIFVKGPKHLSRKFCENNQAVRCAGIGKIALVGGANTFDFSKIVLEAGDLPNPDDAMKQDGVVNSIDYSLWKARIGKEDNDALTVADVNFDGIVNSIDWQLMRVTLETKYEEEE